MSSEFDVPEPRAFERAILNMPGAKLGLATVGFVCAYLVAVNCLNNRKREVEDHRQSVAYAYSMGQKDRAGVFKYVQERALLYIPDDPDIELRVDLHNLQLASDKILRQMGVDPDKAWQEEALNTCSDAARKFADNITRTTSVGYLEQSWGKYQTAITYHQKGCEGIKLTEEDTITPPLSWDTNIGERLLEAGRGLDNVGESIRYGLHL